MSRTCACAALAHMGAGARRARLRDRGGDPSRRDLEGEVRAHPGDPERDHRSPPRSRRRALPGLARRGAVDEARDYLMELPGVGRKTAACVLLFAYGVGTYRSTPMSRVSGCGWGCCAPGHRSRDARPDARAHPTRAGARAARQPAAPRPAHLPCAASRNAAVRPGPHVPKSGAVRLTSAAGQHGEGDDRVVQSGRDDHQRVEDLVVAEDLREGVGCPLA